MPSLLAPVRRTTHPESAFFAQWNGFFAAHPDLLLRINSTADIERAHQMHRTGIMLTMQNSTHFQTPRDVDEFFGLGQRISQLSCNTNNGIGSGFLERRDGGLSVFGASIMKRMEEVGMGVDVSHCRDQTTLDALQAAKKPVLFTHAACRAIVRNVTRNKTDEAIRLMAKTGGVMGIDFIRFMVRDREPVTTENVLDHFDYVRKLVGVEHLATGSDLDAPQRQRHRGLRPKITAELRALRLSRRQARSRRGHGTRPS
jgi:membrane dipeptidase